MTDESMMRFGKHKGTKMADVPADYLDWLADQDWLAKWPEVEAYIADNRDVITQELREQGKG